MHLPFLELIQKQSRLYVHVILYIKEDISSTTYLMPVLLFFMAVMLWWFEDADGIKDNRLF